MRRVKGTAPTRARVLGDARESGRLNIPGTPPAESSSPGAARLRQPSLIPNIPPASPTSILQSGTRCQGDESPSATSAEREQLKETEMGSVLIYWVFTCAWQLPGGGWRVLAALQSRGWQQSPGWQRGPGGSTALVAAGTCGPWGFGAPAVAVASSDCSDPACGRVLHISLLSSLLLGHLDHLGLFGVPISLLLLPGHRCHLVLCSQGHLESPSHPCSPGISVSPRAGHTGTSGLPGVSSAHWGCSP